MRGISAACRQRAAIPFGLLVATLACSESPQREPTANPSAAQPERVELTWLSVTGWLLEAGATSVVLDGYVTRLDRSTLLDDGTSTARALPDSAAVREIRDGLLAEGGPDWVLVGHTHWDHAWDAPSWALVGGGRLAGAPTVCHVAEALGLDHGRCMGLEGGEQIELGPHVSVRAVRWHHSGDGAEIAGRRLRAPLGLPAPPTVTDEGLRPGFLEDFPNGGGGMAYLFTVETRRGPVRILWSNSGNPQLWEDRLEADPEAFVGVDAPPIDHLVWTAPTSTTREALQAAVGAEGADTINVWIGFGNVAHVDQVLSMVRPKVLVPHHWDDFWRNFWLGANRSYPSEGSLARYLSDAGITLLPPVQYFDRFEVDVDGMRRAGAHALAGRIREE